MIVLRTSFCRETSEYLVYARKGTDLGICEIDVVGDRVVVEDVAAKVECGVLIVVENSLGVLEYGARSFASDTRTGPGERLDGRRRSCVTSSIFELVFSIVAFPASWMASSCLSRDCADEIGT